MKTIDGLARKALHRRVVSPLFRAPTAAPHSTQHLGEAEVTRAAADLELSLSFCAMVEESLTREELIRKTAYLHAQERHFAPGAEIEDWCIAERKVDHWLGIYGLPRHFSFHGVVSTSV